MVWISSKLHPAEQIGATGQVTEAAVYDHPNGSMQVGGRVVGCGFFRFSFSIQNNHWLYIDLFFDPESSPWISFWYNRRKKLLENLNHLRPPMNLGNL